MFIKATHFLRFYTHPTLSGNTSHLHGTSYLEDCGRRMKLDKTDLSAAAVPSPNFSVLVVPLSFLLSRPEIVDDVLASPLRVLFSEYIFHDVGLCMYDFPRICKVRPAILTPSQSEDPPASPSISKTSFQPTKPTPHPERFPNIRLSLAFLHPLSVPPVARSCSSTTPHYHHNPAHPSLRAPASV